MSARLVDSPFVEFKHKNTFAFKFSKEQSLLVEQMKKKKTRKKKRKEKKNLFSLFLSLSLSLTNATSFMHYPLNVVTNFKKSLFQTLQRSIKQNNFSKALQENVFFPFSNTKAFKSLFLFFLKKYVLFVVSICTAL
jgi:hypothetical protein